MERNPYFSRLQPQYVFSEIRERLSSFRKEYPHVVLADLAIGDTTQPIDPQITSTIEHFVHTQSSSQNYQGYGPEAGILPLREKLATLFYEGNISIEEITISDGAKNDLFRLFSLFGPEKTLAVQDPTYPAYIDISYLTGVKEIIKLPGTKENHFIPELPKQHPIDIFCLCFPNNPTGSMLSHGELQKFVSYAREHNAIIIFDTSYRAFITDPTLPKSIFEIPEARYCAIEVGSFSKSLGFTGMRLGWTVIPKELCYTNGLSILQDWQRFLSAVFNGASRPIQEGGCLGIDLLASSQAVAHYQNQGRQLREALSQAGFSVYGGAHAPYVWVELPRGVPDKDAFDFFLHQYHIVATPGYAFGECGKDFVRFSALAKAEDIATACKQLTSTPLSSKAVL